MRLFIVILFTILVCDGYSQLTPAERVKFRIKSITTCFSEDSVNFDSSTVYYSKDGFDSVEKLNDKEIFTFKKDQKSKNLIHLSRLDINKREDEIRVYEFQ